MKFAKELERELVPEWRIKYLNYKAGKKRVKAVSRALRTAVPSPHNHNPLTRTFTNRTTASSAPSIPFSPRSWHGRVAAAPEESQSLKSSPAPLGKSPRLTAESKSKDKSPANSDGKEPSNVSRRTPGSGSANVSSPERRKSGTPAVAFSTTIPPTDPSSSASPKSLRTRTKETRYSFSLPAPAINVPLTPQDGAAMVGDGDGPSNRQEDDGVIRQDYFPVLSSPALGPKVPIGKGLSPNTQPPRPDTSPGALSLTRMFTLTRHASVGSRFSGRDTEALDTLRARQREFSDFLDSELAKVESFYQQKEEHAGERLKLLQAQLHEMRDRRSSEVAEARRRRQSAAGISTAATSPGESDEFASSPPKGLGWTTPIRVRFFSPGSNSKSLAQMPRTPMMAPTDMPDASAADANRDYTRRRAQPLTVPVPEGDEVPYRLAKRKLKLALQEFHRSLELLKSYALLNRTAFRKLNKKYDKAVGARPSMAGQYMTTRVNTAYFVTSDVIDGYLRTVEDLYARYFERGNRKVAVGKLRRAEIARQSGGADVSDKTFWSGLMIGLGLLLACQGVVLAARLMRDEDDEDEDEGDGNQLGADTAYLLQIYAGYFIGLVLFGLFCLDCKVWTANKVNYHFIFEFNPRDQLDWRELALFPSFFTFLFGLCVWLNFNQYGDPAMFLYYPVILIGITVGMLFFPAPVLWHRSRKWFAYSHWRLFCAGLYPVEFRDFFLGDMYCSLTYAVANVELFFCLYARKWDEPQMCNSSHSRLMGFLIALPPIWRFFQCIRRYRDTRNAFPHLVNCGKYGATIATAAAQSFYRIHNSRETLIVYVTLAVINAIYCSFWDLFMDFSLVQSQSRHAWLRDILAIKQRWVYYVVLFVDPLLRFAWIPYAIVANGSQHSSLISFIISLAEVCRRAFWALFRVENEHCANVSQYKASRDVPLPYRLELFVEPEGDQGDETETETITTATTFVAPLRAPTVPAGPIIQQPSPTTSKPSPVAGTPSSRARAKSNAARSIVGVPLDETDDLEAQIHPLGRMSGDRAPEGSPGEGGTAASGMVRTPTMAGVLRRRRPSFTQKRTLSKIIAEAHKQDFEKRRKTDTENKPEAPDEGEEDALSLDEATDDEGDGLGRVGNGGQNGGRGAGGLRQVREEHHGQEEV